MSRRGDLAGLVGAIWLGLGIAEGKLLLTAMAIAAYTIALWPAAKRQQGPPRSGE